MTTERAWFTIDEINEWADRYLAKQKEKTMTDEDEEFNRIEREASLRKAAVHATVTKRPWVSLMDEEIMAIGKELGMKCKLGGNPNIDFDYARAIEALLKEKNT